jgi:hypothetical protein
MPCGRHLVRRHGLSSPRGRGTWNRRPTLTSRTPTNRYGRKAADDPALPETPKDQEVGALSNSEAWARLLAEVLMLDVMACTRCGAPMSVITVIFHPAQIHKIIACLDRHGGGPPRRG